MFPFPPNHHSGDLNLPIAVIFRDVRIACSWLVRLDYAVYCIAGACQPP